MKSNKFMIMSVDDAIKRIKNWKCRKCGCTEPVILSDTEKESGFRLIIKCKECGFESEEITDF